MNKKFNFSVIFILFFFGCATAPPSIDVTPVPTSILTSTPFPTSTPSPNITPTNTPSPIITPTATPTIQPTMTPEPDKPIQSVKLFYDTSGVPIADSTSYKPPLIVDPNTSIDLKAQIIFTDGSTTNNIVWRSSDETILKIDDNGIAKGLKDGEAQIIVLLKGTLKEVFRTKVFVFDRCPTTTNQGQDCNEQVIVIGKVYDSNKNLLNGAKITAKSLDLCCPFYEELLTVNGEYVFNARAGVKIEFTASKEGFITSTRTEVLKSGLVPYVVNVINFGGPDSGDNIYALQKQ